MIPWRKLQDITAVSELGQALGVGQTKGQPYNPSNPIHTTTSNGGRVPLSEKLS